MEGPAGYAATGASATVLGRVGMPAGNVTENIVPCLFGDWLVRTRSVPPCLAMMPRVTHNPRPLPLCALVVKNGSKMHSSVWDVMPQPLSQIETHKSPGLVFRSRVRIRT